MNTQPPEPLGSGKDLPCGWKDGKQSGFWKEQRGRVVSGSLNAFRDENMLRSNPGTPGSVSSPAKRNPMAASDTFKADHPSQSHFEDVVLEQPVHYNPVHA